MPPARPFTVSSGAPPRARERAPRGGRGSAPAFWRGLRPLRPCFRGFAPGPLFRGSAPDPVCRGSAARPQAPDGLECVPGPEWHARAGNPAWECNPTARVRHFSPSGD
ncbi:hypothetical protein GCM10010357_40510 [Streptomyces luteireticuli]|uniref:Uncharacterized protein n=1 Tax=Streptomyces luteireticuli TaxID=173858 RepID=A0ABP3IQ01_9ACTN